MSASPQDTAAASTAGELEFQVVLYPAPVLRVPAEDVPLGTAAEREEVQRLVQAMFRRMFASKGVGLAAPQVGLKKRVLVLNPEGDPQQAEQNLALINPRIVARAGSSEGFEEGCLSFPGIYAEVQRPARCTVEAFDLEGRPVRAEYDGFVSRIIQHEYDHLEGVLLVDRMSPADRLRNRDALEELKERYREAKKKQQSAAGRG